MSLLMQSRIFAAVAVALMILDSAAANPRQPDPFVAATFLSASTTIDSGSVAYRLYVPHVRPVRPLPLIVWFHGREECGTNNSDQLAWIELLFPPGWARRRHDAARGSAQVGHPSSFSAFILAVQAERDWGVSAAPTMIQKRIVKRAVTVGELLALRKAADRKKSESRDPLKRVQAALNDVCARYKVDTSRLHAVGISNGGEGAWQIAAKFPGRFATVVTLGFDGRLSEPGVEGGGKASIGATQIWCFHSRADGQSALEGLFALRREFRFKNGQMRITSVNSPTHDCWTSAFRRYELANWILRQRLSH